ncbi:MAG: DUF2330 domain-containing protein [Planctomycetota bacterium]|jgi:hypothetical protein
MRLFRLGGLLLVFAVTPWLRSAVPDGKVVPPKDYKGSLEEKAQEAIIVFQGSEEAGGAVEDLVLKISVQGSAKTFGWVVPFPSKPEVFREDARLFSELFRYVEMRRYHGRKKGKGRGNKLAAEAADAPVKVLSRKIVGKFDVAVVRENKKGALNTWLEEEGFQTLANAEDVIGFYREKNYVFACIKVSDAALQADEAIQLHPLRFTFKTGGRDGIYFPMKMTGLQTAPFDVNLYVFYRAWLNDKLSKYGYVHRGFRLKFRDFDSPKCEANAGKTWSAPADDSYLAAYAKQLPTVTRFFQKLHPGERYYLTNIQAKQMRPQDVRQWRDDLWLFPYYVDKSFVPYDARPGGPAALTWAKSSATTGKNNSRPVLPSDAEKKRSPPDSVR